ncbi:MAG: PRC-barrel domain-containing protein [Rhodospirillaceae bacterium]|nr:PRC-barrel domain-containing protein [Rhodospirillaceae bacterium]
MRHVSAFVAAAAVSAVIGSAAGPAAAQGFDFDRLMDQAEEMWDNTGRSLESTGENIGRALDDTHRSIDQALAQPAAPSVGWLGSDLIGARVVSPEGETLATVDDFVVSPDGRVMLAILRVGGAIGVGGRLAAAEYPALWPVPGSDEPRFVMTRDELEALPAYRVAVPD